MECLGPRKLGKRECNRIQRLKEREGDFVPKQYEWYTGLRWDF